LNAAEEKYILIDLLNGLMGFAAAEGVARVNGF